MSPYKLIKYLCIPVGGVSFGVIIYGIFAHLLIVAYLGGFFLLLAILIAGYYYHQIATQLKTETELNKIKQAQIEQLINLDHKIKTAQADQKRQLEVLDLKLKNVANPKRQTELETKRATVINVLQHLNQQADQLHDQVNQMAAQQHESR